MASEISKRGRVNWYSPTKGFGFVLPDGEDREVFVHITAVERSGLDALQAGMVVAFDAVEDRGKASVYSLIVVPEVGAFAAQPIDLTTPLVTEVLFSGPLLGILKDGDDGLLRAIGRNNALLHTLSADEFENFTLQLLRAEGFDAERVTPKSNHRDGGVDIIAVRKLVAGVETKFAVQCKRNSRNMGMDPIRSLNGILDRHRVHQGMMVITGSFTAPAKAECEEHFWNISLRDYENIARSLARLGIVE